MFEMTIEGYSLAKDYLIEIGKLEEFECNKTSTDGYSLVAFANAEKELRTYAKLTAKFKRMITMKYFLDTEFIEQKGSIQLISIGLKCEDGRKLHLVSSEYRFNDASDWVIDNVIEPLYMEQVSGDLRNRLTARNFHKHVGLPNDKIAEIVIEFTKGTKPEFWAYYADYDWVVFCWLFGTMMELPEGYPMYCRDLKQLLDETGKDKIPDPENAHNALVDAEWNEKLYSHLVSV